MKLKGKVLKNFIDMNDNKEYTVKDEYKEADIYEAERARYEELYSKGFVEKGKLADENIHKL